MATHDRLLRCKVCGQTLPDRWVDAQALRKLIAPFYRKGTRGGKGGSEATLNGHCIPHNSQDYHLIKHLPSRKRVHASLVETLFIRVDLDPHLIDEILIQD